MIDQSTNLEFQKITAKLEENTGRGTDVCPHCGHCKHCGRGGGYFPYYVPYQPSPWYYQPHITWGKITSSTSAVPWSNS